MAATYVPLATTTLSTTTATVTFSSISGSYTDLILVIGSAKTASGGQAQVRLRLNSDSGSNYSFTSISGNGSAASSFGYANQTYAYVGISNDTQVSTNIVQINNYSNSTTYKTMLSRENIADGNVRATVNLWRSTSAITQIDISHDLSSFVSGSTFTLYGVTAA